MIIHCPYCEFTKPNRPLSDAILKILADPELPIEDYLLWLKRQVKIIDGHSDYSGVKVHIGHMHKKKYNSPGIKLTKHEVNVLGPMVWR